MYNIFHAGDKLCKRYWNNFKNLHFVAEDYPWNSITLKPFWRYEEFELKTANKKTFWLIYSPLEDSRTRRKGEFLRILTLEIIIFLKVLFPPMSNKIKNANETDEKWRESRFFFLCIPNFSTHQRVIFSHFSEVAVENIF